jgi:hypothetical protein
MVILRDSISFRDAVLLMVSLPMSPLAVSAAIVYKATSRTGRQLGRCWTPFGLETIAAEAGDGILFTFDLGH